MSDPNGYDHDEEALTSASAVADRAAEGLMDHLMAHCRSELTRHEIQQRCNTLFDFVVAICHPSWSLDTHQSDGNGAD